MPEEISVHDNRVLSFTVECQERSIRLSTEYYGISQSKTAYERTDIHFAGVLAYHIEGDTLTTILFDIVEVPLPQLYEEYEALFRQKKNYGWPGPDYGSGQELIDLLQADSIKAFRIHSSCGMEGFILAQEVRFSCQATVAPS